MDSPNEKSVFIVWNAFQRRAQSIGKVLEINVQYYYFPWEEQGKLFKAASYLAKAYRTTKDLIKSRPSLILIQLAPTPLLYITAIYCLIGKAIYISDCHNTMIYDDHWIKWPFAKALLKRSKILIVHNEDVRRIAAVIGLQSVVLRDPLPNISLIKDITKVADIDIKSKPYVIVPCSIAADEPIKEIINAAQKIPETAFMMTGRIDKLATDLRKGSPANICFTGFLDETEFNALYANASLALILTTREGTQPSGASEAIALGIPIVISDLKTTRRLYKNAVIFVQNKSNSIAEGIKLALSNRDELTERVNRLKEHIEKEVELQIVRLQKNIFE